MSCWQSQSEGLTQAVQPQGQGPACLQALRVGVTLQDVGPMRCDSAAPLGALAQAQLLLLSPLVFKMLNLAKSIHPPKMARKKAEPCPCSHSSLVKAGRWGSACTWLPL